MATSWDNQLSSDPCKITGRQSVNEKFASYVLAPPTQEDSDIRLEHRNLHARVEFNGKIMIPVGTREKERTMLEPRVFMAVPDMSRGAYRDSLPTVLETADGVGVPTLAEIDYQRFTPLLDSVKTRLDEYDAAFPKTGINTRNM